jgi:hypothetical protein
MEAAAAAWSAVPNSVVVDAASSSFTGLLDLVVAPGRRREGSPPPSAYLGEECASVVDEIQRHGRESGLRRCVPDDGYRMCPLGAGWSLGGPLLGTRAAEPDHWCMPRVPARVPHAASVCRKPLWGGGGCAAGQACRRSKDRNRGDARGLGHVRARWREGRVRSARHRLTAPCDVWGPRASCMLAGEYDAWQMWRASAACTRRRCYCCYW